MASRLPHAYSTAWAITVLHRQLMPMRVAFGDYNGYAKFGNGVERGLRMGGGRCLLDDFCCL